MKKILVLADFSEASDRALDQAARFARASGAELHLFTKVTYPPPQPPTELLENLDDAAKFDYVLKEVLERPEQEARRGLDERVAKLRKEGYSVTPHFERSGDLYDRVERGIESVKPDLVAMGTHGRSGVRKWLMGSLAERVLRHVAVDVLTLHEDAPVAGAANGVGEILVATDFSDCSRRAVDAAYRLAPTLSGTVTLLHVMEPRFRPIGVEGEPELLGPSAELRAESESALRDALAGRQGEVVLREGNAAAEIERVARERGVGLVVQGTHGRTGWQRALLGSVAERVVRMCRLPVLTVR